MRKLTPYTKDLMTKHLMTLPEALKIVKPDPFLGRMINALQMAYWENTREDERRLVAAIVVSRNRDRLIYDGKKWGIK